MKYTIKQLAEYSGVSTRTLRYYDKIGLLSPAYYAENGYRFYSNKELLLLQQILFFKEIGLKLSSVKEILLSNEFNQIKSLAEHKSHLINKVNSYKKLISTVDKTMKHLQGELDIKEHELYIGFQKHEQIEVIKYLKSVMGNTGTKIIDQAKEKMKNLTPEDVKLLEKEKNNWIENMKKVINNGELPSSAKTQDLVEKFYINRIQFCNIQPEEFIELIKAELEYPAYKKKFTSIHPNFTVFFLKAIKYYIGENIIGGVCNEK